jgi:hypothetical protein
MRPLVDLCLLLLTTNVSAQSVSHSVRRSLPVICTYSTKFQDVFSFSENQATLSSVSSAAVGIYSEKRFMLKDLNLFMVAAVLPHSSGGIGLLLSYAGNNFYNETTVAFSFGKKLSELLSLGIQFNYYHNRVTGEKASRAVNVDAGVVFHFTETFQTGFHVKNLVNVIGTKGLPEVYAVKLGYDVSEKLFLTAGMEKQQNLPSNITVAIHYALVSLIYLQCGLTTVADDFFIGIGFQKNKEKLEIKAGYQSQLGFTPSLSLIFPLQKKAKE